MASGSAFGLGVAAAALDHEFGGLVVEILVGVHQLDLLQLLGAQAFNFRLRPFRLRSSTDTFCNPRVELCQIRPRAGHVRLHFDSISVMLHRRFEVLLSFGQYR